MLVNLSELMVALMKECDLDPYSIWYARRRLKNEGLSFLTKTLPELGKAVIRSLEIGYFDRPTNFHWKRKSLLFMKKFLDRIFNPETGLVLDDPDPLAIYLVRQVCEYSYKLALDFTEEDKKAATEKFIETDLSVAGEGEYDCRWVDQLRKDFETHYPNISKATVDSILKQCPPRPGPGTFSGIKAYSRKGEKWYKRKLTDRSVSKDFWHYSWATRPLKCVPHKPNLAKDLLESEVLFVPKDSRGPRTIVREPFPTLLFQMSFNKFLSKELELASSFRVNFRSQQVNRDLAQQASINRKWATLDLSNASDSVSAAICGLVFRNSPGCRFFIANRTAVTRLPDGTTHTLKKLSGMGSGLTFPTMSLLITLTITRMLTNRTPLTYKKARDLVYVYGDDIIVPTAFAHLAVEALNKIGLKVNSDKCFIYSNFRESCGGDYYNGQEVAPVRLKLSGCQLSHKGEELDITGNLSWLEVERHCRELVKAGLYRVADVFYACLQKEVGHLPAVTGESPVLGRYQITPVLYETDATGAYKNIRVIVPVPVREPVVSEHLYPFIFLRSRLTRSKPTALEQLFEVRDGSQFGEVEVPHKIRYVRKRVSSFRLMG